jgi:hypothetical protein
MRPGPIPVKALLRKVGETIYSLLVPGVKSDVEQNEARASEKLDSGGWGLKAELDRDIERAGDWKPELRQIWPEWAPGDGAMAR